MEKSQIGVIGLAVMGQNLASNLLNNGLRTAVYNRTEEITQNFAVDTINSGLLEKTYSLENFVNSLEKPRKIIMLIKAGKAIDEILNKLLPLLSAGDILIDGGNSLFSDTENRSKKARLFNNINFLGMGISGGEKGALLGPSLMPGGDQAACQEIMPILSKIAAQSPEPCVAYMGEGAAGHYVKMVHNGIEYADMQLIAEIYDLANNLFGMDFKELANLFGSFNKTELESYLIEITAQIFKKKDHPGNDYLLDKILDCARGKGTGQWAIEEALRLEIAVPSICASVQARHLSANRPSRFQLAPIYPISPRRPLNRSVEEVFDLLKGALLSAKILAYNQGFELLRTASTHYQFAFNLFSIAKIWRGGCIIRAKILNEIAEALENDAELPIIQSSYFREILSKNIHYLKEIVGLAAQGEIGIPALANSLSYFFYSTAEKTPANLIQAQRDFFGSHQYQRNDRTGIFHTEWE